METTPARNGRWGLGLAALLAVGACVWWALQPPLVVHEIAGPGPALQAPAAPLAPAPTVLADAQPLNFHAGVPDQARRVG